MNSPKEAHHPKDGAASAEPVTPISSPRHGAPTLLVVDDDKDVRDLLVHALGRDYQIFVAENGRRARAVLENIPAPDAIISDIMMPELDGLELASLIRRNKATERVPILFLTARASFVDVVAGINAGARHYMTKPFKLSDVVAKVATMVPKKG